MSNYTTLLGNLIENSFDIGLKDYPIYDEKHRQELNEKIINHYYFREIGFETAEMFKRKLNIKMKEIMPFYNQKYKSEDVEFNPLYNIELHETYTENRENVGESTSNLDTINSSKEGTINVEADTPQGSITIDEIRENKYASKTNNNQNENINNGNSKSINNSKENGKNTYSKDTIGSSAGLSFSHAIGQWREIMINIDMEIIAELSDLFMNVW